MWGVNRGRDDDGCRIDGTAHTYSIRPTCKVCVLALSTAVSTRLPETPPAAEWEPMAGEGPRSRVAEGAGTSGSGEKTGGGSNNGGDGGGAGPAGSAGDEEGRYVSFVERYGYGDWLDLGYPVDPASGPTRPPEPGWDEPDLYTRASPGNTDEFMRELSERAARMETDKLPFRGPAGELPPEDAESLLRRIQVRG